MVLCGYPIEGKGREWKGMEGKGKEGKGREWKGREWKGRGGVTLLFEPKNLTLPSRWKGRFGEFYEPIV